MNSFSITQLQDYSGIKAHTIRIWEQRYNALQPERSDGNTRSYDSHQLRRLLNIVSLMNSDIKISALCQMSDADLNELIDDSLIPTDTNQADAAYYVSQLISAAIDFNEGLFDKLFSNSVLRFGLKKTYTDVIYPALVRLGLMWTRDALPPAHEHFIINLIRQKLLTAIDALPPATDASKAWLLFLPEDEFHETGLLVAYFLIRSAGHKVYYLGANMPVSFIPEVAATIKPLHILTFLVSKKNKDKELALINELSARLNKLTVHLSCDPECLKGFLANKNLHLVHSPKDLEEIIA